MPQKKRTTKRKTTTRKRRSTKGKVYIPANSIISLCAIVVGVCTALLLASTAISGKKDNNPPQKPQKVAVVPVQPEKTQKPAKTQEQKKSSINKSDNKTEKSAEANTKPEAAVVPEPSASVPKSAVPETSRTEKTVVAANSAAVVPEVPEKKAGWDIPDFPQAVNNAKIVIIFDDGGQNLQQLEKCLSLPFPVTVAVLPKLVHSKETADRVRRSGNEVMLHQPMQSVNLNVNPGPGAITPDMEEDVIKSTVYQNIHEIGPVAGMNNHEGSLITADIEKMETVMKLCSQEGVFFLDSRTNKDTKVPYVAKGLGYGYYERNGQFLDNTKVRSDILSIIEKNVQVANRQGTVIMIGHVWSADVLPGILREVYPVLSAKGYTFTTVSKSGAYKR